MASALSVTVSAQLFSEVGDAGATLATANTPGTPLQGIRGMLSSDTDADLFRIFVNSPSMFSATTVGGTTLDTTLFLLKADGSPAFLNDDAPGGLWLQSTLSALEFPSALEVGYYYLGITNSGYEPENINGQLLFSPFVLSPTETRGPASGLLPDTLHDFTSLSFTGESGAYTIRLTAVGAVPEPSTYGILAAACLALAVIIRRRRNTV